LERLYHYLETDASVAGTDEVQQFVAVLADEWFQVVARHIMPLDAIVVEVVQNGQTGFIVTLQNKHEVPCNSGLLIVLLSN
jgi:hypothetical protein